MPQHRTDPFDDPGSLRARYAAQRADGSLSLLVINLSGEEISKPLAVNGIPLGQAENWLFDADHPAVSLGAVESLIEQPASMSHASYERADRIAHGGKMIVHAGQGHGRPMCSTSIRW